MSQSSPSRVKQPATFNSSHTQPPSTSIGFNQVLQEVQASVMESIPSLDVSEFRVNNSASQHTARLASKSEQNTLLNLTLQGRVPQCFSCSLFFVLFFVFSFFVLFWFFRGPFQHSNNQNYCL